MFTYHNTCDYKDLTSGLMQALRYLYLLFRWALLIAWGIAIAWLSLSPSPPEIETTLLGWDKFQHAAAYGVFTILAGWAFGTLPLELKKRWLAAVILAVIFGGALEVAQAVLTSVRTAELSDLFADLAGASIVYFIVTGRKK